MLDKSHPMYIFPSSFNRCVLKCSYDGHHSINTLFIEESCDSLFLQLAFTNKIFAKKGTVFECELLEPKDSGRKYLILVDVLEHDDVDWKKIPYIDRYAFIKKVIESKEYFDVDNMNNEYRVKEPSIWEVKNVSDVSIAFNVLLPNYFGHVNGVRFCQDMQVVQNTWKNDMTDTSERDLIVTKTRFSDVYHVSSNGTCKVKGNPVIFVPDMKTSLRLREMFMKKNSLKLKCSYNEQRHKWIPIVN